MYAVLAAWHVVERVVRISASGQDVRRGVKYSSDREGQGEENLDEHLVVDAG